MSYENELITKIIRHPENTKKYFKHLVERGLNSEMFLTYGDVLKGVVDYYKKYKKVPTEKTFKKIYPNFKLIKAPEPFRFYTDAVLEDKLYSDMVDINEEMVSLIKQDKPRDALSFILDEARELVQKVNISKDLTLSDKINKRIEAYNERRKVKGIDGIPCGFASIDKETGGWHNSELVMLIGRMGSFKTWILILWAVMAWEDNYNVLFFSKEMDETQVARRVDSLVSGVKFKDIKAGSMKDNKFKKFEEKLKKAWKAHSNYLKVIGTSGIARYDLDFISSKIEEHKPSIVFIDGVYFLQTSVVDNTDWKKHQIISQGLKSLAKDKGLPIVASTQVGRGSVRRKKQEIELHHIAYSDTYAQDADDVIALNRQWDDILDDWGNLVSVEILKLREGENKRVMIKVDLDNMNIDETSGVMNNIQTDLGVIDNG